MPGRRVGLLAFGVLGGACGGARLGCTTCWPGFSTKPEAVQVETKGPYDV